MNVAQQLTSSLIGIFYESFYRNASEYVNTSMLFNQPNGAIPDRHEHRKAEIMLSKPISNKYGIDLFGMMHFTIENIRCIVFLIYNNTYTFYDQVGFHVI